MLFLILVSNTLVGFSESSSPKELVFVNVLYRHGSRTPDRIYPNDPYGNSSYWSADWGELTDEGKREQYHLGQWLRRRYYGFLPTEYSKKDIHVYSTEMDRAIMSAQTNLAGLYPPKKNWYPSIKWQPIPVHTIPFQDDDLLLATKPCVKYNKLLEEVQTTPYFKDVIEEYKDVLNYINANSGLNIKNISGDLVNLYETLLIEELAGFELPQWTSEIFPEPLTYLGTLYFERFSFDLELARLKSGPLLKEIVNNFESKINGTTSLNMMMYSAHDVTVYSLLKALNVSNNQPPPFCATVLLELYNTGGEYFVDLSYKNDTNAEPYDLKIPGCEDLCSYERFLEFIAPLTSINWEEECNA